MRTTKMEKKRKRETKMKPRSSLKSTLSLDELPDAIIELIFSKLPFSILYFTCRHVCKSWMNLISISISISISSPNLPFFALTTPHDLRCIDFDSKYSLGQMIRSSAVSLSLHPNYSDHYSIQIVNSCRGLLCCSILDRRDSTTRICVLNPTTKEYIQLPSSQSHDKLGKRYYYGFGFSPKTKQFKIVRHSVGWGRYRTAVEIWAFGTIRRPKWILVPGFHFLSLQTHGTYFDGALYWVAGFRYRPDLYNDKFLYRFDLEDNKLNFFTLPELGIEQDCPCHTFFFQVLNDFFYLTLYTQRQSGEYQVWKMEEDRSSWIKVFVVPELELSGARRDNRSFRLQLIKVCEDGKIMCLCDGLDLLLYDPVTRMTEILTDQALETKQQLEVYPVDSFNFNSLHEILAGDG